MQTFKKKEQMDAAAHKVGGKLTLQAEQKTHLFIIKGLINAPHSSQHNAPVITNGARYWDVFGLWIIGHQTIEQQMGVHFCWHMPQ